MKFIQILQKQRHLRGHLRCLKKINYQNVGTSKIYLDWTEFFVCWQNLVTHFRMAVTTIP